MKFWFLAAGLLGVAIALSATSYQGQASVGCGPSCEQGVATAVYWAWNEMDCDSDIDVPTPNCTDDLENVNVGPKINSVRQVPGGEVVSLTVTEGVNLQVTYEVTVGSGGQVLRSR